MINNTRTMCDRNGWIYNKVCFPISLYVQISYLFQKTKNFAYDNISWIMNEFTKWQKAINKKLKCVTNVNNDILWNTKEGNQS